ncbi:MAG TPA: hypothetical protein VME66_04520 [Candidatus Acidoferrales bacterium]|nr:hypothetical protein [Candidatus Acidoferrales bacterium]
MKHLLSAMLGSALLAAPTLTLADQLPAANTTTATANGSPLAVHAISPETHVIGYVQVVDTAQTIVVPEHRLLTSV